MNRVTAVHLNKCICRFVPTLAKFSTCQTLYDRASSNRQGKILSKLFGNRVSGSKKRWFENPMPSAQPSSNAVINFTHSKKNDHGSNRRMAVLNKLFMAHITDLLATGNASQNIIGKGLQITRVKVTPNFQFCNVYWMGKGGTSEIELEEELQKCGGLLRHELSQLRLMGEVPRIYFVKDKTFANLAQVETVLKTCDFGEDHKPADPSYQIKRDLYNTSSTSAQTSEANGEEEFPPMRHDVFGLDRREIMSKILAKMKKSEAAWQQHDQGEQPKEEALDLKLDPLKEKVAILENDSFNKFLAESDENKRPRFKRFRRAKEPYYRKIDEDQDDPLEDGDYIEEEYKEK